MAGILYHTEIPCHLCYIPYLFFQYECYFTVIVNVTFSLFAVFVHVTVVFPGFIPTNSISSSYIPSSISSNARTEESSTVHFNWRSFTPFPFVFLTSSSNSPFTLILRFREPFAWIVLFLEDAFFVFETFFTTILKLIFLSVFVFRQVIFVVPAFSALNLISSSCLSFPANVQWKNL